MHTQELIGRNIEGNRYFLRPLSFAVNGRQFLVQVLYSYDFAKKRVRYKAMKKIYFTDSLIFHSFNSWLHGKDGYRYSEELMLDEDKVSLLVEGVVCNHSD